MNFKKIMSTALAGVMALSLAAPALAAANTATSLTQNTEVTGSTEAPTIKMAVSVGGSDVTDQIISATQFIDNASDVAVKVSAQVTGTAAGNLAFATASTQTKAVTTNSVFMYFEKLYS